MNGILSSHKRKGVLGYLGIPLFLALWFAASYSNAVDPLLLPPPLRVIQSALDIGFPLVVHFSATLLRVLAAYLTALVVGSSIGILMQYGRALYALLDGLIETWRPVPPVALVPFFILVFGFSETGRFVLAVVSTVLIVIVTVVESIDRVDPVLIQFGLTSGLSRARLFRKILIPAAIPGMRAGFRIALASSLTIVVVSEFLGSEFGLGYLISVAKVTLTTSTMFLCIILLGFLGFALDLLVRFLFHLASAWEFSSREAIR